MRLTGNVPEGDLSQFNPSPFFDPELGWSTHHLGNNSFFSKEYNRGQRAVINMWQDGTRASHPAERQVSPYMVLLLGCSFTLGVGVQDHETYAWLLNSHYRDISFDNYGGGGYGTYQCYLLEKHLLNEHFSDKYDLVIYAAIPPHLLRNVTKTFWQDLSDYKTQEPQQSKALPLTSIQNEVQWCLPRAYLIDKDTYGTIPTYEHWYGDDVFAIIHATKHLYQYCQSQMTLARGITEDQRRLYRLLLEDMNTCARQHGAKFATICLDYPENIYLRLDDKPSFPYVFVTDGREYKPDAPIFHVGGKSTNHPSAFIHQNWARHIEEWLDTYLPRTTAEKLSNHRPAPKSSQPSTE